MAGTPLNINQLQWHTTRMQSIGYGRKAVVIDLRQLGITLPEGTSPLVRVTGFLPPVLMTPEGQVHNVDHSGAEDADNAEQAVSLKVEVLV